MTPGWSMASLSWPIQAGIPCRGFSSQERELDLESDSGWAFSEDMDGAGTTGATTGTAAGRYTTTIPTSPTAERSSTTTISVTTILTTAIPIRITSTTTTSITATSAMAMRSTAAGHP